MELNSRMRFVTGEERDRMESLTWKRRGEDIILIEPAFGVVD